MSELVPNGPRRHPLATAAALVVLTVAVGVGLLAAARGPRRSLRDPNAARLTDVLSVTIAARGIDAAVAQYRSLREQGFPGAHESEADTNRLGYALLRKGEKESARQVLELNVEAHPDSANVHDSLGEAYLALGDTPRAIEAYQQAVAIDPRKKSALRALQKLTGLKREPFPPLLLFHIGAGAVGLLSGAAAMSMRKGARGHRGSGRVFVVSMLSMSATGAYMAFVAPKGDEINILMGLFTFYLVVTGASAIRRREGQAGLFDRVALVVALALAVGLFNHGLEAESPTGPVGFVFGAVAGLAATLDLRMILGGGVFGAQRIARHLWRMGAALFIAVTSLFLGQPQVFPEALRGTGLLALPGLLVVVLVVFWLARVLLTNRYTRSTGRVERGGVPRTPLTGSLPDAQGL